MRRTGVLPVVAVLMALAPLTMDMYLPALPRMARDLHASPSQVQLSLTAVLVGLAGGQLLMGPLTDVFGRRRPLIAGLGVHVLTSLLCASSRDVWLLCACRLLQGLAVSAVAVVSMATVRDLVSGAGHARAMSRMFLVIGVAPVVAPSLGSATLSLSSWPWIFVVLAGVGVLLLALALVAFPETLPSERRSPARWHLALLGYRDLLRDRGFVALIMTGALMFSMLFCYVAGTSFVLQGRYGLSFGQYAGVLALNGVLLTLLAQLNPVLIGRFGPAAVLTAATVVATADTCALAVALVGGRAPLGSVLALLAVPVAAYGLSMPNCQALSLHRQGARAGTASALLGATQFALGGAVAPVVGLGGSNGVLMAVTMAALAAMAATIMLTVVRRLPEITSVR